MDKIYNWLKWFFWDSWHGREASAYEITRTWDPFAPVLELGNIRIPRWVVFVLLAFILAIALVVVVGWLARISFVSQDTLVAQTGTDGCLANIEGRVYIAADCLLRAYGNTAADIAIILLVFIIGCVVGYLVRPKIEELRGER